jgi:hypothetical protein
MMPPLARPRRNGCGRAILPQSRARARNGPCARLGEMKAWNTGRRLFGGGTPTRAPHERADVDVHPLPPQQRPGATQCGSHRYPRWRVATHADLGPKLSSNWGEEGPTAVLEIIRQREVMKRNFLATLALSAGVPMILHGGELGRTQRGNGDPRGLEPARPRILPGPVRYGHLAPL